MYLSLRDVLLFPMWSLADTQTWSSLGLRGLLQWQSPLPTRHGPVDVASPVGMQLPGTLRCLLLKTKSLQLVHPSFPLLVFVISVAYVRHCYLLKDLPSSLLCVLLVI